MKRFAPILLVLLLGAGYLATLLPGIGYSGDTIKFQYLGHLLGIPHPPGYPLYMTLNYLMSLLPFGSLAYKANLFSALCAVLACAALYALLLRLRVRHFMAFAAALTYGFSQAFWSQAVVAEVYTLHIFLMALVLYLLVSWHVTRNDRYFYLATAFYALSFGNHLLAITLLPAVIYLVWVTDRSVFVQPRKVFWVVFVVALGAFQYSYLFWRFNDPQTLFVEKFTGHNFFYYVTGGPFKPLMFAFSPAQIFTERLPLLFTFMYDNLKIVSFFAVAGGVLLWRGYRVIAVFLLLYYLTNAFYALNYDVPDIWGYFLPNDLVMVIFAGFFGEAALRWAQRRGGRWKKAVPGLALFVPLALFGLHYARVDRHGSTAQRNGVETALKAVGQNAIIMTPRYQSDQAMLYYLFGEGLGKTNNLSVVRYRASRALLRAYLEQAKPLPLIGRGGLSKTGLPVYSYPCLIATFTHEGFTVSKAWKGVQGLCRLEASVLKAGPDDTELFQEGLFTENLTPVKRAADLAWRWGLGPATRLDFRLKKAQALALTLRFTTPFEGTVTVIVNGKVLTRMSPPPNEVAEHILSFRAHSEANQIVLRYSEWNGRLGRSERLFPDEPQPLAVRFDKLRLSGPRLQVPLQVPQAVAGLPLPN